MAGFSGDFPNAAEWRMSDCGERKNISLLRRSAHYNNHPSTLIMSDLAEYIDHGIRKVTPRSVESFRRHLPELQLKMVEIDAPKHPHLFRQLEFLTRFVEDCADGEWKDYPFVTFAEALFALAYVQRGIDIIPDMIPGIGYADDSSLVRAVLVRSELHYSAYAEANKIAWDEVSTEA